MENSEPSDQADGQYQPQPEDQAAYNESGQPAYEQPGEPAYQPEPPEWQSSPQSEPSVSNLPESAETATYQPAPAEPAYVPPPRVPEPAYAPSVVGSHHAPGGSGRRFFKSLAYLPEYAVMLMLLGVLVAALNTLIGIGIDALIKGEPASSGAGSYTDLYIGNINSFELIWSLSALIASLPFFAWLFVRTRNTEAETPEIRQHRWRKAFLGIFLVVEGLTAVGTVGGLVYDLLGRAVGGQDASLLSYFSSGAKDPWWQVALVTLLNLAVLVAVIFVLSRDYRARKAGQE